MRIAITAPTGKIGRQLAKILLDHGGHELVLIARDAEKLKEERTRGAQVVQGDLSDPPFIQRATRGADALFWLIPPDFSAPDFLQYQMKITQSGVHAVRENGIRHVVLLSSIGGHLPSGTGPVAGLHAAEEAFRKVASSLTILRPAFFMENFLASIDSMQQAQSIYLPISAEARIPMIATRDIAAAAARALTTTQPTGEQVVPLHGPRDYSFAEAAQAFGQAMGKQVSFVQIGLEQARGFLLKMGASENAADVMLELYSAMTSGHLRAEHPRSPQWTTPTTLEEFAREVLAPAARATTDSGRT